MAGLTAAAYISKAGLKVLLCEKENQTGGLVNSFEYKGFVFDGGIRAIEDSGIVSSMLRQLGLRVEFLPNPVSVGIGKDVITVSSKESLGAYQELLDKHFPDNKQDIAGIIREIAKIMDYMDVLYGIDNPLFLDLKNNPKYVFRTILPWALKYLLTAPKIARLRKPVDEYLAGFSTDQALLDIIAQHFFQKTPTFFALSYFSLYLDYRYPRGGTGALPKALEQFILGNGGEIRQRPKSHALTPLEIKRRMPGRCLSIQEAGLGRGPEDALPGCRLASLTDSKVISGIETGKAALAGKIGAIRFSPCILQSTWRARTLRRYPARTSSTRRPSPVFLRSAWTNCAMTTRRFPPDSLMTDRVSRTGLGGSWITPRMRYPIPLSGMPHSRRRAKPDSSSARCSIMP